MPKQKQSKVIIGLFGILSFTTPILFFMGPDWVKVPAFTATLVFGLGSWILSRKKRLPPSDGTEEIQQVFESTKDWITRTIEETLGSKNVEVRLDPASFDADTKQKRVVYLNVTIDGLTLNKNLLLPMNGEILSANTDESRNYLLKEQILRFSRE